MYLQQERKYRFVYCITSEMGEAPHATQRGGHCGATTLALDVTHGVTSRFRTILALDKYYYVKQKPA